MLQAPALPGTPGLDEHRAWVVARNKGEPVVFVRTPEHGEAPTPVVAAHRRILDSSRFPSDFLNRLSERGLPPQLLRQIVLRRGYVYGKNIAMSNALVQAFELRDIFDEPEIWIERGSRRLHATRGKWGKYYYKDGPDAGRRAKYFHFDRLGVVGQSYGPPLHRDARRLMHELHFDRMRVQHRTENHVVARLRYGGMWVTTLLRSEGARLELVCEAVPAGEQGTLARVRREAKEQAKVMVALRASMLKQVREELPFDEPDTEWGQEDGALFLRWEKAYLRGHDHYRHHYDRYPVFTDAGQPRVPQVCIDFLTHTLERASGTWWAPEGEPRKRHVGGIDFDQLMGDASRRRVPTFIDFVREHPARFEIKEYVPSRHRYKYEKSFFRHLEQNLDDFQPGDMVMIFGRAPWDHFNVPHYHSFFIYDADPLTGMPILLAGNAGRPRVRSWQAEMGRAPLRGIRYRIRPNIDWLAQVVTVPPNPDTPAVPPIIDRIR